MIHLTGTGHDVTQVSHQQNGQRGRDSGGSQRRSPLDLIMNQIRRKRSASDRKPLGRFLSRTSDRTLIPEDGEAEGREDRGPSSATLLQFLPQLEEMDVSWNELIGRCLRALTSHLQHVGGIRTLRLCSCRLNADDITALGEALGCVPLLEILDLSWNNGVGGGALQGLLGKLPPRLRELHLVGCQLSAADAAALGGMVSALSRLCVLDVSCNPQLTQEVDGRGFGELAASLSHISSLSTLRLQACGLTSDCLDALGASLRCLPSVQELDLSCNKGLAGGLSCLTPHLAHLAHLESLDLHLCCLTLSDLEALIQVLPSLTALTELDVSSNKEAGGVVYPLVSALTLTQMKRLQLNSCSLNEASFTALAAGCRRGSLSSLRLLDLSYNGSVGDDGWSALFSAGGLGSLEDVDLSLRPLTSAPCSAWLPALLSALPRLPALTRLALQRWTAGCRDRQRLDHRLRKRSVLLEWDPDSKEMMSSCKMTNQEGVEETPEE
ncbi:hypothetical protein PAMA_008302 [Pampus argenteus]